MTIEQFMGSLQVYEDNNKKKTQEIIEQLLNLQLKEKKRSQDNDRNQRG